jgi:hypothetical protein
VGKERKEEEMREEEEENEEEMNPHCFEDNPMPILKGFAIIPEKHKKVRILIDSGAAINLVSRDVAEEFRKAGGKISKEGDVRIKTANGDRTSINEVLNLSLKIGGRRTDLMKFFILKNLPFDILIGNPGLTEWEADLSWKSKLFSLRPSRESTDRIQVNWRNFVGQHWRKPVSLLALEDIILKPFSQTLVTVWGNEEKWRERGGVWYSNTRPVETDS